MSSVKTWLTKEEVLKDLAKVSGHRVARGRNFDEGYLVVGDAPPPVMIEPEDDEMLQQFGDAIRNMGTSVQCDNSPPDLQGITNLIRMVQGSDEEDDDVNNIAQTSNCIITISKPSKLNPNVKEFVPSRALSSNSSSNVSESKTESVVTTDQFESTTNKLTEEVVDNVEIKPNVYEDLVTKPNDDKTKSIVKAEVGASNTDKMTEDVVSNVENMKPNVYEDLATKLKNEISDAAKSDTFEIKKQKNVAIATLLRLYANGNDKTLPKTQTEKVKEPVKLITPDFYMNRSIRIPIKKLDVVTPESTSTTPIPKSITSSSPSVSSNEVKSEPLLNTKGIKDSPVKSKVDPAIKKSIEKVNNWMGEPVERKSPAVFLSPVTFKRKEPITCKSPSTSECDVKKVSKPNPCGQYQPSNYAADLGKKYMERSKKQKQKVNMWTDLDVILKERDEKVVKKQLQQASATNNDSGHSEQTDLTMN